MVALGNEGPGTARYNANWDYLDKAMGNALDPAAAVSRAKSLPRHRSLLSSLGTDPGTGYLAPAGNPNPAMEA